MLHKTPKTADTATRPNRCISSIWPLSDDETTRLVRRIEEAEAERDALNKEEIGPLYKESPNPKAMRMLIRLRKLAPDKEKETMDILGKLHEIMKRD